RSSDLGFMVAYPAYGLVTLFGGESLQRQSIGMRSEPGHRARGHTGDDRPVPEPFARGRIGQVHLHQAQPGGGHLGRSIAQRIGIMGESGGIEDHVAARVHGFMQPAHQGGLVVALTDLSLQAELASPVLDAAAQSGVVEPAVHFRLPAAQPAQVRSVQYQYRVHRSSVLIAAYASVRRSGSGSVRRVVCARPVSTTKRRWVPRAFLSRPITSRSCAHRPGGYCTGSPTAVRMLRCRWATSSESSPARRASSATYTSPTETASPCRQRKPSTCSTAWAKVCP